MSAYAYEEHLRDDGTSPKLAGDFHDDDADYVDRLVTGNASPVIPPPSVMVDLNHPNLSPRGRLLTGSRTWTNSQFVPDLGINDFIEQVLPFDANRKHLQLFVSNTPSMSTPTSNNYVLIADAKDKLTYVAGYPSATFDPSLIQGFLIPTGFPICFDDYTGPLWVRPFPIANGVRLSFAAVTA